jgi:sterol desaturase/sphingolipid hydroxylase (fatty acid hydroxylase superfamily)
VAQLPHLTAGEPATGLEVGMTASTVLAPATRRATVAERAASWHALAIPTLLIAAVTGWLAYAGWSALDGYGPLRAIHAGQTELAGPVVLGFVTVVFVIEQARPAQCRAILSRGHRMDAVYFLAHAVLVVPVIVLIGTGFSSRLAAAAPWLVIPRVSAVPRWAFIAVAVVAIDAVDWLAHLINHKVTSFWRLHAVHHSQEELSILSTFRTHPLVHLSFVISAVPVLALASNAATPAIVLTVYSCLGALPHANVRWTYGRLGKVFVSPAYHRRHHSPNERLDVNLGTVLAVWDRLSRRAVDPVTSATVAPTGLAGRPIPVEQSGTRARLAAVFVRQWAQPFTQTQGVSL